MYKTNQAVIPPNPDRYERIYKHKRDNYLWFVMKKDADGTYSTHLYNGCDLGQGKPAGLGQGHYRMSKEQANSDFEKRCQNY